MYEIDNKYYVKVGSKFVEVELIYGDNDIALKPTKNKIRVNNDVNYKELDFLKVKARLLDEHKRHSNHKEEIKSENEVEANSDDNVRSFNTRKYTR